MSAAGIKPLSEQQALYQPKAIITVMKVLEKEVNEAFGLAKILQFNLLRL